MSRPRHDAGQGPIASPTQQYSDPRKELLMDPKFHPAVEAVKAGDLERFRSLLREDPSLATAPSKRGGSLLQCVVLDGYQVPHSGEMAKLLIDAGAKQEYRDESLIAAASMGN